MFKRNGFFVLSRALELWFVGEDGPFASAWDWKVTSWDNGDGEWAWEGLVMGDDGGPKRTTTTNSRMLDADVTT